MKRKIDGTERNGNGNGKRVYGYFIAGEKITNFSSSVCVFVFFFFYWMQSEMKWNHKMQMHKCVTLWRTCLVKAYILLLCMCVCECSFWSSTLPFAVATTAIILQRREAQQQWQAAKNKAQIMLFTAQTDGGIVHSLAYIQKRPRSSVPSFYLCSMLRLHTIGTSARATITIQ